MINGLLFLSFCIYLSLLSYPLSISLLLFFILFKSFKYKPVIILVFILFQFRLNFNPCEPIEKGRVIEINNQSILVNHRLTNVLINVNDVEQYALQDEVIIYNIQELETSFHRYGFNQSYYYQSRGICYKALESDTFRIEGKGFFHWLSQGGFNNNPQFKTLSRSLLFQSTPDKSFELFLSLGLIYSSLIKAIELCFLKVKNRKLESICILFVFIIIGYYLGYPLSLVRVCVFYLSTMLFQDRMLRLSFNILIFSFISPYGLTQLAFVLPIAFQFFTLFLPMKSKYIQRLIILIIVLTQYNQSNSILYLLSFPILNILYRCALYLTTLTLFIPLLTEWCLVFTDTLNSLFIFMQSLFVLKGHISVMFILIFLIVYQLLYNKKYQSYIYLMYTFIAIPLLSLPLFPTVTLINVGQGDSILIQQAFNQSVILLDTGSPYQWNALNTYLKAQSIYKIDYLLISHDDSDHSGNLDKLLEEYRVDNLIYKGKDINLQSMTLNHLPLELFSDEDNDLSQIYHLSIHNKELLFMGDLSTFGEMKLKHTYPFLRADILKIGHHGSNTSTSDELLQLIQPRIALIGVGKNHYGHPSDEVLNRLDDYYVTHFNTMDDGDIQLVFTPFFDFIWIQPNRIVLF